MTTVQFSNMVRLSVLFASSALGVVGMSLYSNTTSKTSDTVAKTPAKVTYAEHIAPILNDHCVSCHHPGEVGPFSLVGYENSKKQSLTIAAVTASKQMPPWKAVHGYGDFKDENRLTDTDLAMLKTWSETGAVRGDPKKEPKPPVFSSAEWQLGKPDLTLTASKPFKLEAEGEDVYRNFVFDPQLKEDVYVTAVDVKPSNKKVVHHVIAFLDSRGRTVELEKQNKDGQEGYTSSGGGIGTTPSGSLGGWAPGVRARHSEAGTGFLLKPGTKIVMQVHYHKSGKPEADQTKLALYYAKAPIKKEVEILWCANPIFALPPGADNHKVAWNFPIPGDATIYTVMPHMHLLGKSMKAKIKNPDGTETPLVFVDQWDFNWQLVYTLQTPIKVQRGSKLSVEAYYDNSTNNPNNPTNPPKRVTWGEQTTDEMALLVVGYSAGH